jgi:hypothetical protein
MTDDEIEPVLIAVRAALKGELRPAGLPAHEQLSPEWRVRWLPASAEPILLETHAIEAEAVEQGCHYRRWELQHRLVSDWQVVPLPGGGSVRGKGECPP